MDPELQKLRQLIHRSDRVVAFTGAGISTESGIPDFRGPNGVWKKMTPIDFGDFVSSEAVRRESWRRKFSGDNRMANAKPNAGHLTVAALHRMGKLTYVITQNVDGLHQKAGVPEANVIQLHGNANYATCLSCAKRYELDDIRNSFFPDETVPSCNACGGIIKTATISFGQPMPEAEMARAEAAVRDCDLLIVMGSSLVVYPAAGFPMIARQHGSQLVIINNEVTDLDAFCDLALHRPIGATLSAAID